MDNLLFSSSSSDLFSKIKTNLSAEFTMKDLGPFTSIIKAEVREITDSIYLS